MKDGNVAIPIPSLPRLFKSFLNSNTHPVTDNVFKNHITLKPYPFQQRRGGTGAGTRKTPSRCHPRHEQAGNKSWRNLATAVKR